MPDPDPTRLETEIARLREQLELVNTQRVLRVHGSWWRLFLFQFYRGLAMGLGTVLGATILVSVLGFFLAQINFIPIIGEWASEIADVIRQEE